MSEDPKAIFNSSELLLLLVVTLWGTNYPIAKFAISGLGGFAFNSIRFITASLILLIPFTTALKWRKIDADDPGWRLDREEVNWK